MDSTVAVQAKGFRVLVPGGQELSVCFLEIFHAAKGAAPDSLAG